MAGMVREGLRLTIQRRLERRERVPVRGDHYCDFRPRPRAADIPADEVKPDRLARKD